jgi:uncharacterized protein (DUF2336 family)
MAKPPPTFASLEGLLDHGHRDGFDIRPTLLRVLTDLYLQKPTHPMDDERYYTELALRLINSTDVPARAAVAERLALYPASPRAVILRLARDVIDVAGPILRHAPGLSTADLELIMVECGSAHAAIIAMRLRRPQPQAVERPATAAAAPAAVAPAAVAPAVIAPAVIVRAQAAGTQASELRELFFSASRAERQHILLNLEYASPASPRAMPERPAEIVSRLEVAALAHNIDGFAREVEIALGISARLARRIVGDELGEPIVVVAKALRAPRAVLERILLFVNPRIGQSVQRVYELAARYDEISTQAALCLVAIWQTSDPREQDLARPQPLARRPVPEGGRPASPLAARRPLLHRDPRPRGLVNR